MIAPTGTISFMMDAQTTGIEPAIGLISYKTLVGGGYMKLVNTDVERALTALGYDGPERTAILAHVDATGAIEGAPRPRRGAPAGVRLRLRRARRAHDRARWPRPHDGRGAARRLGRDQRIGEPADDATVEDVSDIYTLGWRLGLKARSTATARSGRSRCRPRRSRRKPQPRRAVRSRCAAGAGRPRGAAHKFSVGGQEGYITVGLYDDGSPGEVFVKMSKQGSTVSISMDSVAIAWSMALQHGVPVESLISKYIDHRFEPSGFTGNPRIPMARSVVDYLARWMASRFLSEEDQRLAGVLPLRAGAPGRGDEEDVPDDQLSFREVATPAEGWEGDGARSKLVLQSTGQVCDSAARTW